MFTSNFDFGYPWWMTWGHLVPLAVFALLALAGWRLGWRRWVVALSGALALWGLAGFLILQSMVLVNQPLAIPAHFLPDGTGRVLDMGAGSGRASIGVLAARPMTSVVALDIYRGYWGIEDNTPDRLERNAAAAGVASRVEVRVGDMREMPFPDGSFDGAISSFAIDHLGPDDAGRALREAARVLKPGGQMLILNLGLDGWIRVALPSLHGHGYFGHEQATERWRTALTDAGFDVVEIGRQPGTVYFLGQRRALTSQATSRRGGSRDPPSRSG
jgi:SAM-dependent methyltransferase